MYNKSQLSRDLKAAKEPKKMARPKDIDYVSMMGYRDDSPFNDRPYIDINTPDGTIDMSNTGIPLMANGEYLPPYSGIHQFDTDVVREVPLAEFGGTIMELDDDEIQKYRDAGYVVDLTPYPERHNPANAFSVKDPRSMQPGGIVGRPTFSDSLALYKNALAKDAFYRNQKDYNLVAAYPQSQTPFTKANLIRAAHLTPFRRKHYVKYPVSDNLFPKITSKDLLKRVKQISKNLYSTSDFLGLDNIGWYIDKGPFADLDPHDERYNPDAPPILYSPYILPQGALSYSHKLFDEMSLVPYYDPVMVKPWSMLTDKEKEFRRKVKKEGYVFTNPYPPKKVQKKVQPKVKTENDPTGANAVEEVRNEGVFNDIDKLPTLPLKALDTGKEPGEPILSSSGKMLTKRYNKDTGKWVTVEVPVSKQSKEQYQSAEDWRKKNPQRGSSSHEITPEEYQKFKDEEKRRAEIAFKMISGISKMQSGGTNYEKFRKMNLIDLNLDPQQAAKKYMSIDPELFQAYLYYKAAGYRPGTAGCSGGKCYYDEEAWKQFTNKPEEKKEADKPNLNKVKVDNKPSTNLIKVNNPSKINIETDTLDETGNVISTQEYYDFPPIVMPTKKAELIDTNRTTPNIEVNEQTLIKRYSPEQNRWILDEVSTTDPALRSYQEAVNWANKNPQNRQSSLFITPEEYADYNNMKKRQAEIMRGFVSNMQEGGSYNIGDEVDEDTMLMLKELGYEFE